MNDRSIITIIGLGYVGLPLAIHFAKRGYMITGLDKDKKKLKCSKKGRVIFQMFLQ